MGSREAEQNERQPEVHLLPEGALQLRDQFRGESPGIIKRHRLIGHRNSDDGRRSTVLQKGVAGKKNLAHVFAGDNPTLGLIPIKNQPSLTGIRDRIFVDLKAPAVRLDIGLPVIPNLPAGSRKAMLGRVHALPGTLFSVIRNEEVGLNASFDIGARQIARTFQLMQDVVVERRVVGSDKSVDFAADAVQWLCELAGSAVGG